MKKLLMFLTIALLVVGGTVAITHHNAHAAAVVAEPGNN